MRRGKYRPLFVEPLENRVLLSSVPNGPFGLTATAGSATSVNLAFYDSATNETGFTVQRSTTQNGAYATIANLPAAAGTSTKVTYTDTSAVGSTTYFYKVFAVNPPYSSSATTATVTTPAGGPVTPPTAPSNISASLSGNSVLVSFTDNSNNESDFILQRATSAGGPFTNIATLTGDAATGAKQYTDSNVNAGTTYYYQIFAENSAGPSSTVGPTSGVAVPVPTPPTDPSGLSAALSGNSVVVSFTDNSTNENDFVVQRSTSAGGPFTTVGTVSGNATTGTRTYTDSSTAPTTTYYYQIYAENDAGPSSIVGPSNSITTPTNTGPNPGGAPNGPFGFTASANSANSISLAFYDSATNETGFVIQRATSSSGPFTPIANLNPAAGSGSKVTYTDTSTVGSTTYYYKVYAVNGPYSSGVSNVSVTTPAGGVVTAPSAPSNFDAALSGSNILITFTDNSNNESDFKLLRSTSTSGPFTVVATINGDAATGAKQYTDTTVAAGTTYYYELYAENSAGPSTTVGPTSGVTTPAQVNAPTAPSNVTAALSGSQVLVSFTDNSNNESDFVILRSTTQGGSYTQVGTVTGDAATGTKNFTDTSAAPGTTYFYDVYAENSGGHSATAGPSAGITTPSGGTNPGGTPNGPYVFSATAIAATQINLTFYDSASNETGFVIARSTSAAGPFTTVATLPPSPGTAGKVTYADTTVIGSTKYFYQVYAINGPYKSGAATANATTPAGTGGGGTNANVDATRLAGNEMESQIAINPTNPNNIVLVAQNDVNNGNMVEISRSINGGATWTTSTLGGAQDGFVVNTQRPDARVAFDGFGNLYITYMVGASDGVHLVAFRSSNGGASFTYVGSLVGGSDGVNPDDPVLATGIYAGNNALQGFWVMFDDDNTNKVDLLGGTSSGLGQFSLTAGHVVVSDLTGGYPALAVGPTGQLAAVWQTEKYGNVPDELMFDVDPTGLGTGFGLDKDLGTNQIGAFDPIPAQPNRTIDAEVNLAFDNSNDATRGRLYLVYADNTTAVTNDTDVELLYTDNLGSSWTSPLRVNNDIGHNSQFLPALAVDPTTGNVGVSWYDARNSADNTTTQLYIAVSTDHGATFSNTQIANGISNQAWANSGVNDLDYGDNGSLAYSGGFLSAIWSDNSNSAGGNPNGTDSRFDVYVDVLKT